MSNYVMQRYGATYATADSLFSRGRVLPRFIDYLFKPGDTLVRQHENEYQGWLACSWPYAMVIEPALLTKAEIVKKGAPNFLLDSMQTSREMKAIRMLMHKGKIDAWHWSFDGNFHRQKEVLDFTILAEDTQMQHPKDAMAYDHIATQDEINQSKRGEVVMEDLVLFPLKYASSDIVNKLRRRGKMFWSCRNRRFVSYQENEKAGMRSPVSLRAFCSMTLAFDSAN